MEMTFWTDAACQTHYKYFFLIVITTLQGKYFVYAHFIDEKGSEGSAVNKWEIRETDTGPDSEV